MYKILPILSLLILLFINQTMAQEVPEGVLALQPGGYAFTEKTKDFSAFTDEGITVEFWFYLTDIPKDYYQPWSLFYKRNEYSIIIRGKNINRDDLDGTTHIIYRLHGIGSSASSGIGISPEAPPEKRILNRWIHVAYQIRGEKIVYDAVFLDGEIHGLNIPHHDKFQKANSPLFIGGDTDHSSIDSIEGWIDEVRISRGWRYERKPITPKREFESDEKTIALWHFDEPFGATSWEDSSGNGHTLFAGGTTRVENKGKLVSTWGIIKLFDK